MLLCLFLELNITQTYSFIKVYKEKKRQNAHFKEWVYLKNTQTSIAPFVTEQSTINQRILKCTSSDILFRNVFTCILSTDQQDWPLLTKFKRIQAG